MRCGAARFVQQLTLRSSPWQAASTADLFMIYHPRAGVGRLCGQLSLESATTCEFGPVYHLTRMSTAVNLHERRRWVRRLRLRRTDRRDYLHTGVTRRMLDDVNYRQSTH